MFIKAQYNEKQQRVESEIEENRENPDDNQVPRRYLKMGLPLYEGRATDSLRCSVHSGNISGLVLVTVRLYIH
jgi:hypothetical protein